MNGLDHLLDLQFLFWAGWIISACVVVLFIFTLVLQYFLKQKPSGHGACSLIDYSSLSDSRFPNHLVLFSAVLFAVVFLGRYGLGKFMFGSWYLQDDAFDSCIMPYQLSQGEPLWGGGGTNYLTYFGYLMVYQIFDFSPGIGRTTNIVLFAIAFLIFYWALWRAFGSQISWFVLGMIFLSFPFITHSIYATAITFSLLPFSIILYILINPLTQISTVLLAFVLVSSLFLYPGAFLCGISLIFSHLIFFYKSWTWKMRFILVGSFAFFGVMALRIRIVMAGEYGYMQWAGGFLSFGSIEQGTRIVLEDVFRRSTSWNAINLGAPYFDTSMIGFLIIGLGSSLVLAKAQSSIFAKKWIWSSFLCFMCSVVLSSMAGAYPGVRRIFPAIPLLFLISGIGLRSIWGWRMLRPVILCTIIACFGLVAMRSYVIARETWPLTGNSEFMMSARQILSQNEEPEKTVLIIGYPFDQFGGHHYRCALSFDKELSKHFRDVRVISRSDLSQRQNLDGRFMLLANELYSEKQLKDIFGYLPNSSVILKTTESPRPDLLVAIYDFSNSPLQLLEN